MLWEVFDAFAGQLFHDLLQLALEHGDGVIAATCTECADAAHEGSAHEGEFGTAGEGACDVRAAAQTAVEHDGGAAAKLLGEGGERFDGGLTSVELPSAVVGDDDAIDTEVDSFFSIVGIDDTFDDEFAFPTVPNGFDFVSIQTSGEGFVHELGEVFHVQSLGDIGFHGLELGCSSSELAKRPRGVHHHLETFRNDIFGGMERPLRISLGR